MKFAIAALSLLLVACTQQPVPGAVTTPAEKPAPVASNSAPSSMPAMAKRAAGQEKVDPLRVFRAFGTEPFWNINVVDNTLVLTTPDDERGTVMTGQRAESTGGDVDIRGSNDGRSFSLSVHPGACSEGMSDNQYGMTSTFSIGDTHYTGCAEAAK